LVAGNVALVTGAATFAAVDATHAVRGQLDRLHRASGPLRVRWDGFEAARVRLRENAIAFDEVAALPCAAPEQLLASRAATRTPPPVDRASPPRAACSRTPPAASGPGGSRRSSIATCGRRRGRRRARAG